MLIQVLGCNCSGNDFFTSVPEDIFHCEREFIQLKYPDTYTKVNFHFKAKEFTIEAPCSPIFYLEDFYKSFLKRKSLKVYIFSNSKNLVDLADKDYRKFISIARDEKIIHILNDFTGGSNKKDYFDRDFYQNKYNITFLTETKLGPNGNPNPGADFISALSLIIDYNK